MTTLKQLAPHLLKVIEESQEALKGYQSETNRYALLENLDMILNEPDLVQAINELTESQKPTENNEKFHPDSSQVNRTKYLPGQEILEVEFKSNSKVYHYFNVPFELWVKACAAESIGSFINKEIKGKYEFQLQIQSQATNQKSSPEQFEGL